MMRDDVICTEQSLECRARERDENDAGPVNLELQSGVAAEECGDRSDQSGTYIGTYPYSSVCNVHLRHVPDEKRSCRVRDSERDATMQSLGVTISRFGWMNDELFQSCLSANSNPSRRVNETLIARLPCYHWRSFFSLQLRVGIPIEAKTKWRTLNLGTSRAVLVPTSTPR